MSVVVEAPPGECPDCGGQLDLTSNSPLGGPDRERWYSCRDCGWEGDPR